MAIATSDMKHGMQVTVNSDRVWEVLDRHPLPGNWWLHRWNAEGEWETTYNHENSMTAVSELSPAVTETAKWSRVPFNIVNTTTGTPIPDRKIGYALGKWGAHKRAGTNNGWTVTHLPTGFSVPTDKLLSYCCNMAEVRAVVELLASHDFPNLDSVPFGITPGDAAKPDMERLKALLIPELQAV